MSELARRQPRNVRLRRLAAVLRELRSTAELTREAAAERARIDSATLYRIETAKVRPLRVTLHTLLDLYGVADPAKRVELEALLKKSTDRPGWLQEAESGLPEDHAAFVGFESEAKSITNIENVFVPGLLQTEDYARACIAGLHPRIAAEDVERRVQIRVQRQQSITRADPLELWAIIDEAALRREVGGQQVMAAQLRHLAEMAARPNITFQIVTFAAGAHPAMHGPVVLLEFPDPGDQSLAFVELATVGMILERPEDVDRYQQIARDIQAIALSPADSAAYVQDLAKSGGGR